MSTVYPRNVIDEHETVVIDERETVVIDERETVVIDERETVTATVPREDGTGVGFVTIAAFIGGIDAV